MLRLPNRGIFCFASLTALLITPLPTFAQGGRAQQPNQMVLRTYEVGDLTLNISDRPYSRSMPQAPFNPQAPGGGGFGGGGGGAFSVPDDGIRIAQTGRRGMGEMGMGMGGEFRGQSGASLEITDPKVTLGTLASAIVTTVAPDSWRENGGEGVITNVGSALVIAQSANVHSQIEGLLGALRSGSSHRRTLRIDARWLLLSSDDLDTLMKTKDGNTTLDRNQLATFTRRPASTRGITNCFSGQLVYLVSGTRKNVVTSYIPVVGSIENPLENEYQLASGPRAKFTFASDVTEPYHSQAGVGYQPVITELNFGALLEIRPTLLKDDESVVVDLKSTITVPGKGKTQGEGVKGPPHVDRLAIETQELATTLRMPLGEPFLVGGMTYTPAAENSDARQAATTENSQLYLVLELQ